MGRGKVGLLLLIACPLVFYVSVSRHNTVVDRVEVIQRSPRMKYNGTRSHNEIEKEIERRVARLNSWCSKRTTVDYTDYDNSKLLLHGYDWMYIPEYRLFYCSIPKVASSTMKQTLMEAVGEKRDEQRELHDQAADVLSIAEHNPRNSAVNVPLASSRRNPFISEKEQAKHSLVIVRNPYERLVSAYMDKIVKKSLDMQTYCTTYEPAKTVYRNNRVANITFPIFIDCVLSNRYLPFYDDHVYPMSRACGLCLIKYDMIVSLEALPTEMRYVLSQLDGDTKVLEEKLLNRKEVLNPSTERLKMPDNKMDYKSMYRQLSMKQILQIKLMYRHDFEIFGYDPDVI